jgi:hypothetical protein
MGITNVLGFDGALGLHRVGFEAVGVRGRIRQLRMMA